MPQGIGRPITKIEKINNRSMKKYGVAMSKENLEYNESNLKTRASNKKYEQAESDYKKLTMPKMEDTINKRAATRAVKRESPKSAPSLGKRAAKFLDHSTKNKLK